MLLSQVLNTILSPLAFVVELIFTLIINGCFISCVLITQKILGKRKNDSSDSH